MCQTLNVHIIYDYGAKIPPETLRDNYADSPLQIATYSLQDGKGKVIMMGLYSQRLLSNDAFLKFFDNLVFPQAVGLDFLAAESTLPIHYYLPSGNISKVELGDDGHITMTLERTKTSNDKFIISLPKQLLSPNGTKEFQNLTVLVDNKEVKHDSFIGPNEVGLTIPILRESEKVEIIS